MMRQEHRICGVCVLDVRYYHCAGLLFGCAVTITCCLQYKRNYHVSTFLFFSAGAIRLTHCSFDMLKSYICAVQPHTKRHAQAGVTIRQLSKLFFKVLSLQNGLVVNQQTSWQYAKIVQHQSSIIAANNRCLRLLLKVMQEPNWY